MIKIDKIKTGDYIEPTRSLTTEESNKVVARWGNATEYWYFTEDDKGSKEWEQYQSYLNQAPDETNVSDETVLKLLGGMTPSGIEQIKQILNQI